ncbi:2-aminoadipate transaminase [Polystyrenella longa]|uniref:2-aminoadipate transaminase n=1 Tax=Polystyrenella longa TaxID=2528007 RepID=A0A518CJL2_9PLAN|nr:PLP-dependent aminotransferase family protein [Polystyrenella longa]QDU79364.1 2-aminoadipate transaminase [Polystyrenella longa]
MGTADNETLSPAPSSPAPSFSQRREWSQDQAISYLMAQGIENPDCLSLAAGFVDFETLPVELSRKAYAELLDDPQTARKYLQYGTTAGSDRLRDQLIKHLAKLEETTVEELGIDRNQLVLTTGSQQLLAILADVLFDPGDICLVAAPTYFVFLGVLAGVGAEVITVEGDEGGIKVDALEAQLEQLKQEGILSRVKMLYLVSYYENPTGVSVDADRRQPIVDLVTKYSTDHQIVLLEDAAYRELRYDGPKLPSLWSCDPTHSQVVLAQTFSKSFAPGFRTGFGVLPKSLVQPVIDRKGNEDFGSSHFNQNLIATVLERGWYEDHVFEVCENYQKKRDAMLAALAEEFSDLQQEVSWFVPHGGLYVWLSVPEKLETGFNSELFAYATNVEKVMYVPGQLCYPHAERKNQMRLSFGVLNPDGIRLGIARLANSIRHSLK